jgi:hypothetical protein
MGIERYGCVGTISAISHRNTATQNRRVSASMRLCRPYLPEFDDGYVTDEKRTSNVITMNSNQSGRYNPMNGLLPFEADQQIENYMEDLLSHNKRDVNCYSFKGFDVVPARNTRPQNSLVPSQRLSGTSRISYALWR